MSINRALKGIVLAGGKSSRFGSDKALALHDGLPLVKRAVDLLHGLGLHPAVITRKGQSYPFLDCTVLEDKLPDLGPLGGLYTAMSAFPHDAFCVLTCDMPLLTDEAVSALMQDDRNKGKILLYHARGRVQPFPGIYPRSILPRVRHGLLEGRCSLKSLMEGAPVKAVIWAWNPDIFINVNTSKDLPRVFIP